MAPMRLLRILGAATVAVSLSACVEQPAPDAGGEQIYVEVCARCHGVDLGGGAGPALDAGSEAADRSDEFYRSSIVNGRGRMPSFAQTLSDDQVDRVIEYIRREQRGS